MASTERVKEILDYVRKNPINIQGEKMSYEPLSKLDSSRLPDVVEGLQREDIIMEKLEENRINRPKLTKREEHMADVAMAMLYLGCKGLDEAHDIVLPYTWGSPSFAGQPIVDSPASLESKYCHALVHRKEGQHMGEFGMQGWKNACFWFNMTEYHPLYPQVKAMAVSVVKECDGLNPDVLASLERFNNWNPDWFTEVCTEAVNTGDKNLEKFCKRVMNEEWLMLLNTCHEVVNPILSTIQ